MFSVSRKFSGIGWLGLSLFLSLSSPTMAFDNTAFSGIASDSTASNHMRPQQALAMVSSGFANARGIVEMDDADMSGALGQAGSLILTDTITPNSLTGSGTAGTYANFTYHRMGLDGKLDFNVNMSKLQLGCGGVNDLLTGPGCDLDVDYVSFMGINAAGNAPDPTGAASAFKMTRPFIEFAVKNENDPARREVVGFRIGAQSINGALGLGREYTSATTNLERGGTCNPAATTGAGVAACHSGINQISGFLSVEMSAAIPARANLMGLFTADLDTCFGRMTPAKYSCNPSTTPFFVDAGGTRLETLHVAAAKLLISNIDLNCNSLNFLICSPVQLFANTLTDEGYGQLKVDLPAVHYLLTPNTENFFLSFQRERVSWPNYSKAKPPNNIAFDACNPAYGQASARCSSAYAPAANTGWWLNAPGVKLLNISSPNRIVLPGTLDASTLLSLLGPEGKLIIDNPKVSLPRPDNCYGAAKFC